MISTETTLQQFKQSQFQELGDFIDGEYSLISQIPDTDEDHTDLNLQMKRMGQVAGQAFIIDKKYEFSKENAEINVHYRLTNPGEEILRFIWAVEFNVTLLAGDAEDRTYSVPGQALANNRMNSEGVLDGIESLALRDGWFQFQMQLKFSQPTKMWRFPVETISQSEDGFERTYQGSCLLPHWTVELASSASREFSITLELLSYK